MNILYISQYYPPEIGAPAARVSELARAWSERGHQITVLTAFPHHPHGRKRPEDTGVWTRRETDGPVNLVRTYIFAAANAGFALRVLSYLSFAASAMLLGTWRVGRPDVVIATSPQLFTGLVGWWISRVKGAPFVFEVRDLWPESITTVGAMRDGPAIVALKRFALALYRACDRLVTVGAGYRRRIVANYPIDESKIGVITNGVDLERYRLDESVRQKVRAEHGWTDRTVVLYLGTHGMAHGLDMLLRSAEALQADERFRFVLVGDGAEKARLVEQSDSMGLSNVAFLPPVDKAGVVGMYAAADVCLVPLRKAELFCDVLPSKLFEILAMARPILISVPGEARQLVELAGAGRFVEPEDSADLCAKLTALAADPEGARRLGTNGRRFVERHYSRQVLADRYLALLRQLVAARPAKEKNALA